MNLKPRFLLFSATLIIISGIAVWYSARQQAEEIIDQWAVRYAEKQVLYDKARALQPILREMALSRQFARSPHIIDWARNPDDPQLQARAIEEMESYRLTFSDNSYFVALNQSGHYYHNNASNEFAGHQLRYTLDPRKAQDRWFYDVIEQQRPVHLNVNPDVELGVTKLWIDVLLRDGDETLGVIGTGMELKGFIDQVLQDSGGDMASLLVDYRGAIQLYSDPGLIDYASISNSGPPVNTLERLLDNPADVLSIKSAMAELVATGKPVTTRFVHQGERRYLAGVAYIPEIDWYEITLLDFETLLPLSSFSGILLICGITLLLAMLSFNLALGHAVLRPLRQLERAMQEVGRGDATGLALPRVQHHEIGRLVSHFQSMAAAVLESRQDLELKIQQRTEALEALIRTDPLTELLNRRGMDEQIHTQLQRYQNESQSPGFGIIWLDMDHFKAINDQHGHTQGDAALSHIARLIRDQIRSTDAAARWGGDEFLVLLQDCNLQRLNLLSRRLCDSVAQNPLPLGDDRDSIGLSISAGACLCQPDDTPETLLRRADMALYEAKKAGRNGVRVRQSQPAKAAE
ncbi:diguanylate cyclase domain-containing protein [Marinobacterium rhizophilum]|uniref:diguanylate cyclase n=1 Tax=Marinobacterium rhizophilum TaxID=420402 RepID=A0ABY5HM88_9GAMM|nr:diguanylate cyclase [Marinobacterium rhizophilum]UTW13224.1 diguanylate cyclase [Marinobacterium rhizophilum]